MKDIRELIAGSLNPFAALRMAFQRKTIGNANCWRARVIKREQKFRSYQRAHPEQWKVYNVGEL